MKQNLTALNEAVLTDKPEIEYLIFHYFGRVGEAFQTLELFHLLL